MRSRTALLMIALGTSIGVFAQNPDAGRRVYEARCPSCHGGDGNGGELGPAIVARIASRSDVEIGSTVRTGIQGSGMPAFKLTGEEMRDLIAYLRTLKPRGEEIIKANLPGWPPETELLNRGLDHDLQIRTPDGRVHLLRDGKDITREVTSQTDWPVYNGNTRGNRYSTLNQINRTNISKLAPKWTFNLANAPLLQTTPVVVGGLMYVTSGNECYALDAGTGRPVWHFERPKTPGLHGNAGGGINRGVAVAGDRLFMVTDHAHIIALNRQTGAMLWDTQMADWHLNYNATSAPLIAGGLVVSGTAGGDEGVRGFIAAYDQATGKEVWRFWTVPAKGEPRAETWGEKGLEHPAASGWFTGSYDAELDTVYWPTGNPGPDFDGDNRPGDNLYSDCTLALDAKTGKLKWYFQYTPHDVWDWDASQTEVLIDHDWEGQPRKLLLHANRNGFFYVFDRTNGKLLLGKPFVKKLTWASGLTPEGRPIMNPNMIPTTAGALVCPAIEGATNWFSPSFSPVTGFFYVQALEKCNYFVKTPMEWEAGKGYMAGTVRQIPGDNPKKFLRAIDIRTGRIAWELPQNGHAESWGGALSTASGLVFFCEDGGAFAAADATTGKLLWHFAVNAFWKASPMTYMFDSKQYVAVAAGSNVIVFAIP